MDVQEWLREDFRARVSEIERRLGLRQSVVHYGLVAVGGITGLVAIAYAKDLSLGNLREWLIPMSLGSGLFFLIFTLLLLRHDLFIAYNAQYIERELKTNIKDLPSGVLAWERYVCDKRSKYRRTHYALALSRIAPMALPCLALWGMGAKVFWDICPNFIGCYIRVGNLPWKIITGTLVAVNIGGLALLVWTVCLVSKEEREIAKAAGASLSSCVKQDLDKLINDLETRVSNVEEKVSAIERRVSSLENKDK